MSDGSALHTPRTIVFTALITATTTIGASFIGILPQLRRPVVQAESKADPPAAKEKWSIRGEVVDSGSKRRVKSAEVLLVPKDGEIISTTGDDGSFEFSGLAAGTYSLVVREPNAGSRVMIPQKRSDGSDILVGEVPDLESRPKAFVSYKIEKR